MRIGLTSSCHGQNHHVQKGRGTPLEMWRMLRELEEFTKMFAATMLVAFNFGRCISTHVTPTSYLASGRAVRRASLLPVTFGSTVTLFFPPL